VHFYSTLLHRAHKVPVHSTVVLLRPAADGPDINGTSEMRYRNGAVYDFFLYDVIRIWERPITEMLAAGLAVLPLAAGGSRRTGADTWRACRDFRAVRKRG
jgi:hypothetical protein